MSIKDKKDILEFILKINEEKISQKYNVGKSTKNGYETVDFFGNKIIINSK